jgi:low affinity Fe/Cu permease
MLTVIGGDYMATRTFAQLLAFAVACVAVVVWTPPNMLVFYKQRANFT